MLYKEKAEEQKPSPDQGGPAIPDTKELTLHQKLNLVPISWPEELVAYEPASATLSFTPTIPTGGKEKKSEILIDAHEKDQGSHHLAGGKKTQSLSMSGKLTVHDPQKPDCP